MNIKISFLIVLAIGLFACKKDKVNEKAQVEIRLTDDPCDCQQVNIDLQSIQVKTDADTSHWFTLTTNTGIYDLLQFQNIDTTVATGFLPFDNLMEVRLILGPQNTVMVDSIIYDLQTPSAQSSGLKVKINKQLGISLNTFVLDFDAGESVKSVGNGKYMLDPVIKLK
ncbi:MAG: DUF4382 domain-containing protein [Bacteroidetes bacterium]|nr:DUF4382 domain-containing protein [Bacteroidota bacterium]